MAAEYGGGLTAVTIPPGGDFPFDLAPVPCTQGLVRHRQGSADFQLAGNVPGACPCPCGCPQSAQYLVHFGGNVAVAEGGTAGPISVAFTLNGSTYPLSTMIVTPAAVGDYQHISGAVHVPVWCACGCSTLTVRNTGTQPIDAQFYTVLFDFEGVTRG